MTPGQMLVVFSVGSCSDKDKRNVLQVVADVPGIDHVCTDTNGKNLIVAVVGTMDHHKLASKLSNKYQAKMIKLDYVQEHLKNAGVSAATKTNQGNNGGVSKIDGGKMVLAETQIEGIRVRHQVYAKDNRVIKK